VVCQELELLLGQGANFATIGQVEEVHRHLGTTERTLHARPWRVRH
jgi:hypothetical protein